MRTNFQGQINSVLGSVARLSKEGSKKPEAEEVGTQAGAKIQRAASPQAQAANKARQNAANEIDAKKTQKRNFMDYLKNQPTSLGGKVGDLSPAMQKQIASGYSASQRKKLMEMADREKK